MSFVPQAQDNTELIERLQHLEGLANGLVQDKYIMNALARPLLAER